VVALFIGTIELVGLLTQELGLTGPIVDWFRSFNINTAGFIIVRIFVGTWVIALAVWRIGRIEEKWMAGMENAAKPKEVAVPQGVRPPR
jgi:high-affinity nickel-transport protein